MTCFSFRVHEDMGQEIISLYNLLWEGLNMLFMLHRGGFECGFA